jgi:hypothetical protein
MQPPSAARRLPARVQTLLRIGGGGAILGALLQVAAGTLFGNRTGETAAEILPFLAGQPGWYWPLAYLCFIVGSLLWVCAFVAIAAVLDEGVSWALGLLATVTIIVGVTMHVIDATLNGVALTATADAWRSATPDEQSALLREADALLRVLGGTWASVITLFHGVPFILSGLAVALSGRFPAWLGWLGLLGGAGSVVAGLAMFFRVSGFPSGVYVIFAIVISVFMVIAGLYLWLQADEPAVAPQGAKT